MPRQYTVTDKVIARNRRGAEAINSPDGLITRIERAKANLTPEHIERLRALLASATSKAKAEDS